MGTFALLGLMGGGGGGGGGGEGALTFARLIILLILDGGGCLPLGLNSSNSPSSSELSDDGAGLFLELSPCEVGEGGEDGEDGEGGEVDVVVLLLDTSVDPSSFGESCGSSPSHSHILETSRFLPNSLILRAIQASGGRIVARMLMGGEASLRMAERIAL